jgi:two-component system, NtrC family, response regulator HydG
MGSESSPEIDEFATVAQPRGDSPDIRFALRVAEGADSGQSFTLDAGQPFRVLVGTSPVCDFRLTDRAVSRRHIALDLTRGRVRITDLGSTNGTFVDAVAIGEAYLRGGETIRIGGTLIRVERQLGAGETPLPSETEFGRVIGESSAMRRLYPLCHRLAQANVPAILEGETGTGKEVLAESLHEKGPRAEGPFVVFDCTAVPPNLVEAELFGHEKGAFTGAVGARKGVFELADGGTLLIDEIGDLDMTLQPKLLRAIERSEIRRIGGERSIRVDIRVLAATRRDLDHEIQAGRFRDDLFHRLAVARIELPPLRMRKSDIPVLARHFAREIGGDDATVPGELIQRWNDYAWPGNVRELRNAVARHLALGDLGSSAMPDEAPRAPAEQAVRDYIEHMIELGVALPDGRAKVVERYERRYIERLLEQHDGNVARAAAASGIGLRYFQMLRAKWKP